MATPTPQPLLSRIAAHDRALFARFVLGAGTTRWYCRVWRMLTHLGGASFSIVATLLLTALPSVPFTSAVRASGVLLFSHLLVQLVKRNAGRARPNVTMSLQALIAVPDRFSFPSGHACAVMAVAISYAVIFPMFAVPLLVLALAVGSSRIVLGVHYPGDVVVGQVIALVVGGLLLR